MISDNARSVIDDANTMLPSKRREDSTAVEEKAALLLLIQAKLAQERRVLEQALLKAVSLEKAEFASAFSSCMAKTVGEKSILTDAEPTVLVAKENVSEAKSDIAYLSACMDIYKNAHLLYRQMLRNEDNGV